VPDAIVIGAGPNGLVAANLLGDAGWSVVVLEAADVPGGAVKSAELVEPAYVNDLFSAFYPLGAASPAIRGLELERYGLQFRHGPLVVAHPASDGTCAVLSRDIDETVASLDAFAPGDGDAWRALMGLWERLEPALLRGLVSPMPPVRSGAELVARLGPRGMMRFLRLGLLPVRRFGEEHFRGAGGRRLLAGNALHADLTPESALGGFFGFFLCALGQRYGYPVPEGGAGELSGALVRRAESRDVRIVCGAEVEGILVRRARASGVRLTNGTEIGAKRAVLADVDAVTLYLSLLPREHVPADVVADLRRFERDWSTIKVDWTLDGPVPWSQPEARRSPVVHLTDSVDDLSQHTSEIYRGLIPGRPFLVFGQYSMVDETRSPAGKETAWGYTHVPQETKGDVRGELTGTWDEGETARYVERIEEEIEQFAPGFRALVRGRHVFSPPSLEQANASLVGGAINGGTAQLHNQFVFRPTPGLARPETTVAGLYLASSSAHPGGGVHGGPGTIAARAALTAWRARSVTMAVSAAAIATGLRRR